MTDLELHFDHGTLVAPRRPRGAEWERWLPRDTRTRTYRAPAQHYRSILELAARTDVKVVDRARTFSEQDLQIRTERDPFAHQQDAFEAWTAAGRRGVVEMPTGSGKTHLAIMAIAACGQSSLIVVPTIDLLVQWREVLEQDLGIEVGMIGGGSKDRREVTVVTYDSAAAQMEHLGHRFGLLVCDECHHLPAPAYRFIAEGCIAPHRIGLTATFEREDGGHEEAQTLLGPLCHRVEIDDIEGRHLSAYEVHRVEVQLSDEERSSYEEHRQRYLEFIRKQGIRFSRRDGWQQFIIRSQRSDEGRAAFRSYREQRRIALVSDAKVGALWDLLVRHRHDRMIVFTEDNETVHRLSRQFLLPSITHHTRAPERRELLRAFADGELPALLTSKVLNEGVDVPSANVAVVLSGSGSVREHVQRLGRILRKQPGKRAVLYEVCTADSAEGGISARRRRHRAYDRGEPHADA